MAYRVPRTIKCTDLHITNRNREFRKLFHTSSRSSIFAHWWCLQSAKVGYFAETEAVCDNSAVWKHLSHHIQPINVVMVMMCQEHCNIRCSNQWSLSKIKERRLWWSVNTRITWETAVFFSSEVHSLHWNLGPPTTHHSHPWWQPSITNKYRDSWIHGHTKVVWVKGGAVVECIGTQ